MFSSFFKKFSLITLYCFSTLGHAQSSDILCPSLNTIAQAAHKIDMSMDMLDEGYTSMTSQYAFSENGLSWVMGVEKIKATSLEDSIKKARSIASNVQFRKQTYARIEPYIGYICNYGPNEIFAFSAL